MRTLISTRFILPLMVFLIIFMHCASIASAGEAYVYEGTIDRIAQPMGVRFASDGSLLIAAGGQGLIRIDMSTAGTTSASSVSTSPSEFISSGPWAIAGQGGTFQSLDKSRAVPAGLAANATAIASTENEIAWCVRDQDQIFRMNISNATPTLVPTTLAAPAVGGWLAPESLAFAPDGSLWVADTGHSRVVRIDPTGAQTSFGERGFFPGQFIEPYSIAFDDGGPLISDRLGHRITRLDWSGALRDIFGLHSIRPREGKGKIHYPTSIASDAKSGRVALCEGFERRVQIFRPLRQGEQQPMRPPAPSREGISSHFGVDVSASETLVAAWEPESGTVVLWDTRHDPPIYITTLGGNGDKPGRFIRPVSLLVDENGLDVWIVDALADRLEHWKLKRNLSNSIAFDAFMAVMVKSIDLSQIRLETGLPLSRPVDLISIKGSAEQSNNSTGCGIGVVFASGDIAWVNPTNDTCARDARPRVANVGAARAAVFDATANEIMLLWPTSVERRGATLAKQIALPTSLANPRGIAPSADGGMFVSDASSDTLVELDAQGKIIRNFGSAPRQGAALFDGVEAAKDGALWLPAGVDGGDPNAIYIIDFGNHRLQRFTRDGKWAASFTLSKSRTATPSPQVGKPNPAQESQAVADRQTWITLLKAGYGSLPLDFGGSIKWKSVGPLSRAEPFALEISLVDAAGQPLSGYELGVDAEMPHHNHGMNVRPKISQISPGTWLADPLLFHMPGRWELIFDVKKDGRVSRAQTTLELE